jgi:hypothetical protein
MKTVKAFLMAASCGLVLWGAVAVQAIVSGDDGESGKPICRESSEVRVTGNPCPPPPE